MDFEKHGLIFAGGMMTALVMRSILKSKPVRGFAVKSIAAGMKLQEDAAYELETIREDAQDLVEEKKRQNIDSETNEA